MHMAKFFYVWHSCCLLRSTKYQCIYKHINGNLELEWETPKITRDTEIVLHCYKLQIHNTIKSEWFLISAKSVKDFVGSDCLLCAS